MSRLPTVGGDANTWGDILNDFLLVEHAVDGTLKNVVRSTDSRLTDSRIPSDASVTPAKIKPSASANQVPVASGTSGWNWVTPAVYLEAYGAVGDGATDDLAALNAALSAAPAGATIIGNGSKTYLITAEWTINKSVIIDLQGATIKKAANGTYYAINVTSTSPVTLRNITVSGNRNDTGAPQGLEGIVFGTSTAVTHKVIDCNSSSNGKSGFMVYGGASQIVEFYKCYASNNRDGGNANNANGFIVVTGMARFYDSRAEENDGSGFYIDTSAAAKCGFWNCAANRNTLAGYYIKNTLGKGRATTITAEDNRNYGIFINSTKWHMTSAMTHLTGTATGGTYINGLGVLNQGTGFELGAGASRCRVGTIISYGNRGYGLALSGVTLNDIGAVICDQTDAGDGDPGVSIQNGSTQNSIGYAAVRNHSYALVIGEAGTSSNDDNFIGSLYAYQCSYGALSIDRGVNNNIGTIVSRDSGTTDATINGLINFSTINTTDNIVSYVDHKMIASSVATKPKYLVHADANAVRNRVIAGKSTTGEVQTALYQDQSGGNFIGPLVVPTSKTLATIDATVGGSPFTYNNTDGYNQRVTVQGGTVSKIEISPDGVTYTDVGTTAGMFPIDYGDYLKITYSVAPTVKKKPV